MIASVHVADVGVRRALANARKAPRDGSIPGLRHANVGLCAPLSATVMPKPTLGRMALVTFWDDDAALDGFLSGHPLAAKLAGGWHLRLEPLRAFGSWPGLPDDLTADRAAGADGPVAVLTLARLRASQAPRFLRTSAKAEAAALVAPGMIWATGLATPPFFATCSLWESARASSTYAFGRSQPGHPEAIAEGESKEFHHQSAFIRFRPYGSEGGLEGKNPLASDWQSV